MTISSIVRYWLMAGIVLISFATYADEQLACLAGNNRDLPTIDWIKSSDWLDVTTDSDNHAKGDGVADDTLAIQTALRQLGPEPGDRKVIYFPPGRYRISNTLGASDLAGIMLVGHGRDTIIEWHGSQGGVMFHSNGLHRAIYRGITWDGRNIAAVGIDHRSDHRYETHILHEYSQFRNFTIAGIRVGKDQKVASAEIYYRQLVFENNKNGVLLMSWNDYNNVFDGVHFRNNGTGIAAEKGNFNIRNSRFENSSISDLLISTHSYSVRRTVSVNSNQLVRTVAQSQGSNLVLDNVYVKNWKSAQGAVETRLRGPVLMFDVLFDTERENTVPVNFNNPGYMLQTAILANVRSNGDTLYNDRSASNIHLITRRADDPLVNAESLFLEPDVRMSQKMLDVKQDCGAKGDDLQNDTLAIMECIARADGDTTVYFPSGVYRISKTLDLSGRSITLRGSGFHSVIRWDGLPTGNIIKMDSPKDVNIYDLTLWGDDLVNKLVWTGNSAGSARVHNVFGWLSNDKSANAFVLTGGDANAVFHGGFLDGTITANDTAASTILIDFTLSTNLKISNKSGNSGMIGVLSRASCCVPFPLEVNDSASLTMTDWYNEQSEHLFSARGTPDDNPGRLILDMKRAEASTEQAFITDSYIGNISLTAAMLGNMPVPEQKVAPLFVKSEKTSMLYLASVFWLHEPAPCDASLESCIKLGNIIQSEDMRKITNDIFSAKDTALVNDTLDAFHRLGEKDLQLNHCHQ